ncbi:ABC transporter ATP-binding protein [Saccharopolyspora phatthalungensis]|uniref:Branched-chain amino acid transport system ATP-binding protein n=1 Tax=Saccharopolyspora phatthalungensis TaxID=664693 RepID=A0A840Q8R4_9PSEU|nr:ATP-binding cassette domain-containing protein [Saccharopolyspora phatthalungensis]MBB5158922.1 branched-chain amino acid transport system ATP-binding protein [Saccharopolyspora phatthalungensis]
MITTEPPPDPLRITDLEVRFGGIRAVQGVSLTLRRDEVLGLLGQNGAGKTTVVNCVSRSVDASSGRIELFGRDIRRMKPFQVTRAGVSRTYQTAAVFGALTALQVGMLARDAHDRRATAVEYALRLPRARRHERQARASVTQALELVGFSAPVNRRLGELTYGQAKLADLARAVAGEPRILLLDEPASGLSVRERDQMAEAIQRVRRELGVPVLIIEHDMELMQRLCDRTIVMDTGRILAEGRLDELLTRPDVAVSLLGVTPQEAAG